HHPRRLRRHPPDQHHGASPMTHIPPHTSRLTSLISRFAHHDKTADCLILILFVCLVLVITYPLPLQLATHLAGDDYDVWARPWATWWTKTVIQKGRSLYHTDMLFYPLGVSLVYHSFSHVNTAVALLLEPLAGYIAAHNLTVLLAYILSGFSMYLLGKHITGSTGAGLVAGLIFTFSTYHIDQSSHLIILTTQWIPFWILSVIRISHNEHPLRHALLAALFLALTALSSWHLLLFSALWLVLYLAYLTLGTKDSQPTTKCPQPTTKRSQPIIKCSQPPSRGRTMQQAIPLDTTKCPQPTTKRSQPTTKCSQPPSRGRPMQQAIPLDTPPATPSETKTRTKSQEKQPGTRWPILRALGLMGIVTLILIGPFLFPLLTGLPSPQRGMGGDGQPEWIHVPYRGENATDVLAFFVPSRRHPLIGPFVEPLHHRIGRRQVFLGYVPLALALLGAVKQWRKACFWVFSTLAFFSISLGAYIRFNGVLSERPLQPWLLPLAGFIRDPTRLTVMTTLGLALLAALGIAWLEQKARRSSQAWVVVLGLSVLILFEYLPWPFPTTPVSIPPFYEQLQQETDLFALADIPVRQLEMRRKSMFYQIVHQKPIVEGIVARTPPDAYAFIDQHPILSAFAESDKGPPGNDVSRHLTSLADAGVRYLILHRHFLTAQQVENWQLYLPHTPFYQDDQIIVYRTRPVLGQDLPISLPVNDEIGLVYARLNTRYPRTGETPSLQTAWMATQSPAHTYRVRWVLVAPNGHTSQIAAEELCPGWPTETWQAGDFGLGQYELPADLPPSPYRLQVQLVDEHGYTATRDVNSVLILPAEGSTPTSVNAAPIATFDDQIGLIGMQLLPGDQMLHLYLEWHALQDLDRDYKLFVHLLDNKGQLLRQSDVMPHDWAAPTSAWRKDQVLSDLVTLDTYGLPTGTYTLSMGLYETVSQERLPLRLPDGSLAPDATLQREVCLP
ncbi:MAG: hypothetical protein SWK90_19730, partial [Chloroflexota bacterium]|nr:hypothetical protein [Chloroflexota bacterium]